ncbi:hypothetical protein J6590_041545 [Homalodisca vitripennis]|nr:hypothetical protein J6590_041545 [Homalodisca vitripennis]
MPTQRFQTGDPSHGGGGEISGCLLSTMGKCSWKNTLRMTSKRGSLVCWPCYWRATNLRWNADINVICVVIDLFVPTWLYNRHHAVLTSW